MVMNVTKSVQSCCLVSQILTELPSTEGGHRDSNKPKLQNHNSKVDYKFIQICSNLIYGCSWVCKNCFSMHPIHIVVWGNFSFNPLKTSTEYTPAGVYGKCVL